MSGLFVQVYELAGAVRAVAVSDAPLDPGGALEDDAGPLTIHEMTLDDGAGNPPQGFVTASDVRRVIEISNGKPRVRPGQVPGWRLADVPAKLPPQAQGPRP